MYIRSVQANTVSTLLLPPLKDQYIFMCVVRCITSCSKSAEEKKIND